MTKEKWDSLSPKERKDVLIRHDISGTMKDPKWATLLEDMSRPYDSLTMIQRDLVESLP